MSSLILVNDGQPLCDFCSDTGVFARYPAKDFALPDPEQVRLVSDGDWAACKACSELIEAENWEQLLDRSIQSFVEKHGNSIPMTELRKFVRDLHAGFRANRSLIH